MPTLAYAVHDAYAVVVHSHLPPTDAEWDDYLRLTTARLPSVSAVLIVTAGGGPNSAQRRALKACLSKLRHGALFAVVTPSMMARGIVLAVSLFNPHIRAFRPDDTEQALTFLRVPVAERAALLATVQRLRDSLTA